MPWIRSFECGKDEDQGDLSKEPKMKLSRQLLMKNAGCKQVAAAEINKAHRKLHKSGTSVENNKA